MGTNDASVKYDLVVALCAHCHRGFRIGPTTPPPLSAEVPTGMIECPHCGKTAIYAKTSFIREERRVGSS